LTGLSSGGGDNTVKLCVQFGVSQLIFGQRKYCFGRLRSDQAPNLGPSERDALVAYLQILGQMVDFATFDASGPNLR
jgi:hypothetical protein